MMKDVKPQVKPRLKTPGFLDELLRTVIFVIAVTVLFDMAIPRSLVDGRSMQPTFEDGDRLIVSRLHYLISRPQRGDVVVLNAVDGTDIMLIKRVIGLPGESIEFRDQHVYINGNQIQETYIQDETCSSRCQDRIWQLGPDQYFVMGDNRNHSNDSRAFGPVPLDHIVGHVVFRYWPLNGKFGVLGTSDYARFDP